MQTREAAISAMEQLDERHVFDATGTAISVRWADPDLQQRKKLAMDDANSDNRMLFFAKVLRSTTEDDVRRLFSRFGKVHDVNLFRAFQGAPTTKGCGLVTMSVHSEAVAAINALDGKFTWEGMDCPMVVKWMDTALQRRRREQHLAALRQPLPSASIGGILGAQRNAAAEQFTYQAALMPSMPGLMPLGASAAAATAAAAAAGLATGGAPSYTVMQPSAAGIAPGAGAALGMGMMGAPSAGAAAAGGGAGGAGLTAALNEVLDPPLETPPPGCNPDAIKLFVGNVPKSCTEEQLLPLFQTIGKVVELVIVYDKITHESKGSGFVWFETRADAERAIIQFNLRHIFPDPSGAQDRPLVVRRAKARNRGMGPPGPFAAALGHMTPGSLVASPYFPHALGFGVGSMAAAPTSIGMGHMGGVVGMGGGLSVASLQAGMEGLQLVDGSGAMAAAAAAARGGAGGGLATGMGVGMAGGGMPHVVAAGPHAAAAHAALMHQSMGVVGAGAAGSDRSMQGVITLAPGGGQPAGIYHAYGTDDAAAASGTPAATAAAAGGSYPMMLAAAAATGGMPVGVSGGAMVGHAGAAAAAAGGAWDAAAGLRQQAAVTLALNSAQLAAVNQHMFSVQTVSGATLQLSPGATGLFHLVISGGKAQVEAARNLLGSVLGEVVCATQ
ncbi:hypothetical protein Agub_g12000 [Astrephomene gubernaculifera]|uniref:RRM domain-containing protein n=1 Tax=Astrephomene gubernaculifera TaxID=47775 RepID=A0AAD3HRF3_9CHLO|nr:hypothetical protein Agub_g12000 [Astrephomene gubernaculifera]